MAFVIRNPLLSSLIGWALLAALAALAVWLLFFVLRLEPVSFAAGAVAVVAVALGGVALTPRLYIGPPLS
jgi:hypothetical protein